MQWLIRVTLIHPDESFMTLDRSKMAFFFILGYNCQIICLLLFLSFPFWAQWVESSSISYSRCFNLCSWHILYLDYWKLLGHLIWSDCPLVMLFHDSLSRYCLTLILSMNKESVISFLTLQEYCHLLLIAYQYWKMKWWLGEFMFSLGC
jgi:hypothetical protein